MEEIINNAEKIGIVLAEIVVTIFFCWSYIKQKFKKINVAKMLPKQNNLDLEIITKMEEFKEQLNADRIHVYEFHNGEHYSDNRPAYKFSCTYEVFKSGNKPIQQECKGIATNCMPLFINEIINNGKFICDDLEDLKSIMSSTYNFKHALKIQAFFDIAIRNEYGETIGFVAVHWFKKENMIKNEDMIKKLAWYVEEHMKKSKGSDRKWILHNY